MAVLVLTKDGRDYSQVMTGLGCQSQNFKWSSGNTIDASHEYTAVVVVNDHSPVSARALRSALSLRKANPDLPVFVLTLAGSDECDIRNASEALENISPEGSTEISFSQFKEIIREKDDNQLSVNINSNTLAFVYGGKSTS